jgi:nucleoid DNA-binding protein
MVRKTTPKTATQPPVPDDVPLMKKPDLLDAVVARTNLKKRDVKPAIEAAFAVIREALEDGQTLNMPPLGKLRVVKAKPLEGGAQFITLKLRTQKNATVSVDVTDLV